MFYATDNEGATSDNATVTIIITPAAAPVASYNGPTSTNENVALQITGIQVSSARAVSVFVSQLPAQGSLQQADGTPITSVPTRITDPSYNLLFVPAPNTFGKYHTF